jgi:hypothetical protein
MGSVSQWLGENDPLFRQPSVRWRDLRFDRRSTERPRCRIRHVRKSFAVGPESGQRGHGDPAGERKGVRQRFIHVARRSVVPLPSRLSGYDHRCAHQLESFQRRRGRILRHLQIHPCESQDLSLRFVQRTEWCQQSDACQNG